MAPKKEKKSSGGAAGNSAEISAEQTQLLELFSRISLSGPKALELTRLPAQSKALQEVIEDLPSEVGQLDQKVSGLIVLVCAPANLKGVERSQRNYLVRRVLDGSINTSDKVTAAAKFLFSSQPEVDQAAFDEACGVGECDRLVAPGARGALPAQG
ncbi:hypothetical protein IE81DRAFT_79086 [Ceraceosorus guamensis]|uniref:Glutaminyl-tRNA synthetase class Ib non-specific RNA-binding domain-containing protein n=1 Tax=Ceraceosorus guamensis TaxID=1522189 RepID=A0A316VMC4_9BASI|nr:hypothetical protein IE81DRAFT_79086 [Ceraceosorus guamensis]PWN38732.1 hypothetical protein IE81DRAFT_79086 [Ceraceosorus guamensis]